MKANAAVLFACAALATLFLIRRPAHRDRAACVVHRLVSLLTLSQDLFGWNAGIDELIVRDQVTPSAAAAGPHGAGDGRGARGARRRDLRIHRAAGEATGTRAGDGDPVARRDRDARLSVRTSARLTTATTFFAVALRVALSAEHAVAGAPLHPHGDRARPVLGQRHADRRVRPQAPAAGRRRAGRARLALARRRTSRRSEP